VRKIETKFDFRSWHCGVTMQRVSNGYTTPHTTYFTVPKNGREYHPQPPQLPNVIFLSYVVFVYFLPLNDSFAVIPAPDGRFII
jgi:hypothetical protein